MDAHFAITALATAFTILDPIGMVPTTLALTATATPDQRRRITNRAVLVAAAIIVFTPVLGRLLQYLGISLYAFSIAGGVLLLLIAIDMLFARPSRAKSDPEDAGREPVDLESVAVFPLAIPMISGPGTIATVLLLVSLSEGHLERLIMVYAAFAIGLFVTWLCMRSAEPVMRILGKTGAGVTTRLLGIILAALAVQFILNGLHQAGFGRS